MELRGWPTKATGERVMTLSNEREPYGKTPCFSEPLLPLNWRDKTSGRKKLRLGRIAG